MDAGIKSGAGHNRLKPLVLMGLTGFFALALLLPSSVAIAKKAGDVQKIYSAGQMFTGASGCDSSASKGCDVETHKWDAKKASSYMVNKYSIKGAKVENLYWDYTVPPAYPEDGGNQGRFEAAGSYTCQGNAAWTYERTGGQLCWGAHTLYSPKNCKGARNVQSYPARNAGNIVSASNICSSGACVVDYQPASSPHFVTADTGDNMMAMLPASAGAKGFLIYNYCGSVPYWFERKGPESSKYLMIPTKCNDYQTFVDAGPAAAKPKNACHPAALSMCPSPPSRPAMPPHPGCGSHAHGSTWCSGGYKTEETCRMVGDKEVCTKKQVCQKWSSCDCGVVK